MLTIENTEVFGWEAAIRGARNPMNSWDKSDSFWKVDDTQDRVELYAPNCAMVIGENDLKLMKNLAKAGSDHAKYLRMINVTMDVTAPLYWWKEFDTYKVGTVANSCSTMHKIHSKEITKDDFSFDKRDEDVARYCELYVDEYGEYFSPEEILVAVCENLRRKYLETNDKRYWRYLIQMLPSSYNQKRTIQLNYEVLRHMYFARRNHKLDCWHTLCDWIKTLPYAKELIIGEE